MTRLVFSPSIHWGGIGGFWLPVESRAAASVVCKDALVVLEGVVPSFLQPVYTIAKTHSNAGIKKRLFMFFN